MDLRAPQACLGTQVSDWILQYQALPVAQQETFRQQLQLSALRRSIQTLSTYRTTPTDGLSLPVEGDLGQLPVGTQHMDVEMDRLHTEPINSLMRIDRLLNRPAAPDCASIEDEVEQCAVSPQGSSQQNSISPDEIFRAAVQAFESDKHISEQHRSLLSTLAADDSTDLQAPGVAFVQYLVDEMGSAEASAFSSSRAMGESFAGFYSFANSPTLMEQWCTALQGCGLITTAASPVVERETLQYLISACRDFFATRMRAAMKSNSATTAAPSMDIMEHQKVYYIGGYLVSQLIVREFRKGRHRETALRRADWDYVMALEQLKVFRSWDLTIPEDKIPMQASAWQRDLDKGGLTYVTPEFYELLVEMELAFRRFVNIASVGADSVSRALTHLLENRAYRADLLECVYKGIVSQLVFEGFDEEDVGLSRELIQKSVSRVYEDLVKLYVQVRANAFSKVVKHLQKALRNEDALRTRLKNQKGKGAQGFLKLNLAIVNALECPEGAGLHTHLQGQVALSKAAAADGILIVLNKLTSTVLRGILGMYSPDGLAHAPLNSKKALLLDMCYKTIQQNEKLVDLQPLLRVLKNNAN